MSEIDNFIEGLTTGLVPEPAREIAALVEGENAYRAAEFEVTFELLESVLHMPAESRIIGVRPGDTPYRATLVVKVADPSLPLCPVHHPPMLNPIVTKEQIKWDWNAGA